VNKVVKESKNAHLSAVRSVGQVFGKNIMKLLHKLNSLPGLRCRPDLPVFAFGLLLAFSGTALAAPKGGIQTFRQDGAVNLTVRSADGKSLLRFSCLNGESFFISLFVMDGTIRTPGIYTNVPEADQSFEWLAWHPGQSNIIYAAQPRELLRCLLHYPGARLVFEEPGKTHASFVFGPFDQKGPVAALSPGCQ